MAVNTFTIFGAPRTKKNSQRIVRFGNRSAIIQSKAWKEYEGKADMRFSGPPILEKQPVRLHAVFYRERAAGDLSNYIEGLQDLLQKRGFLGNDSWIIGFTADTRLEKDKNNPRVEGALLTGDDARNVLAYDLYRLHLG